MKPSDGRFQATNAARLGERLSAKKPCIAFPRAATPRSAGKDYFFGS
jgi:hypothetical protein